MASRLSLLFLIALFIFSCGQKSVDKLRLEYLANVCNSVDTIFHEVESSPLSFKPSVLSKSINRLYFNNRKVEAKVLLEKWQQSVVLNSDQSYAEYLNNDLGYYYLWEGNFDSTFKYIQLNEKITLKDTWCNYAFINLKGSYYFLKGDLQAAKSNFLDGYILAKKQSINIYIEKFSVNLGAIAYEENQYGTATKFFSCAYQIIKKENRKNPGLINNLASIYLQEQKVDLAYNTILDLEEELNPHNTNYYAILAKINLSNILIAQNKLNVADSLLLGISTSIVPESLVGDLLISKLKIIKKKNWIGIDIFINKNKILLIKFKGVLIQRFGAELVELIVKKPLIYSILNLGKTDLQFFKLPIYRYFYYKLNSLNYINSGKVELAYKYLAFADSTLQIYNTISDSVKLADLNNSIHLLVLEEQIQNQKNSLDFTHRELTKKRSIITLLFLIIISIFIIGFYIYKNRNQKMQFTRLQLMNIKQEAEFLAKETRLNSKITELSKIIIEKSKFLAESIKLGPYSKEPEIYAVQRELEQLSLVDTVLDFKSSQEILQTNNGYLDRSEFKELSDTQRRILILSVEEFRTKEIALALNLSPAYVRNVKTKLRKILISHGIENFGNLKNLSN